MSIPVLQNPVAALLDRLASIERRWIIGLAGVPGSGKTTWARKLAAQFEASAGPGKLMVLGMDGFHLPKAALARMPDPALAFARRGAPWTFDAQQLAARIALLRSAAGQSAVPWPDFQHQVGDPVENAHVVPADVPLILIEGIYLLYRDEGWDRVSGLLDERWYIDTPSDVSLERLIRRHMAAWGMTFQQARSRAMENDCVNAELIIASRRHADYVIQEGG